MAAHVEEVSEWIRQLRAEQKMWRDEARRHNEKKPAKGEQSENKREPERVTG